MDIVLCYSILEKCKSVDTFSAAPENVEMVMRIRQHRMVISEKLLDFYEEYFQKKSPECLEWYRDLCTSIFNVKERTVIVNSQMKQHHVKDAYYNELLMLSRQTLDQLILMQPKQKSILNAAKKLGISVYDTKDIMEGSENNLFSMYTLPVNGKSIAEGEDSRSIAKWIGRFLQEEDYIQIFDSYLLTEDGIGYLKKYILKYVKEKTEIHLFSLLHDDYSKQQVKEMFEKKYYKKWDFSVYAVKSKKDLHTRSIQGSKYIIQIDRGLSVFGRDGETFQTTISIFKNNSDTPRIVLKESQIERIV